MSFPGLQQCSRLPRKEGSKEGEGAGVHAMVVEDVVVAVVATALVAMDAVPGIISAKSAPPTRGLINCKELLKVQPLLPGSLLQLFLLLLPVQLSRIGRNFH